MRDEAEHRLSHWVNELLQQVLLEPCWYTAQDHSGRAIGGSPQLQMNWRAKQRWYGVKPSQLDWRVIQCRPNLYAEIELKYGRNQPDVGQQVTMRLLEERGIPTGCCWSVREFYDLLKRAGFRLHQDADAIVERIAARQAEAEDAAHERVARDSRPKLRQQPKARPCELPPRLEDIFPDLGLP